MVRIISILLFLIVPQFIFCQYIITESYVEKGQIESLIYEHPSFIEASGSIQNVSDQTINVTVTTEEISIPDSWSANEHMLMSEDGEYRLDQNENFDFFLFVELFILDPKSIA